MDNFLFLPRACASALFDLAFAAGLGCLLALLWLGSAACVKASPVAALLRRTSIACALAMLLLLLAQGWLVTATMLGSASFDQVRGQLLDVVSGTHAGRVLIPQFGLVAVFLLIASLGRALLARTGIWIAVAVFGALACVRAASGHASAEGDVTFAVALEFLHLASIAVWSGGVMIAGLILLPGLLDHQQLDARGQEMKRCAASLSRTSTGAVFVVLTTGLYKGWIGLGKTLQPLAHTQWGILLTVKSALVVMALALGVKNRLSLARNPGFGEARAASFSRWVRAEAVLMVVILVLSGFLANSPPAIDS